MCSSDLESKIVTRTAGERHNLRAMSNVNSTRADGAASMMLSFDALSNPQPASGHFLVAARGSHHRMSGRPDPGHLGFALRECEAKQGHGSAGEFEVVGGVNGTCW